MPLYEFYCDVCGKEVELQQGVKDSPPTCSHDYDPDVDGCAYIHPMKKKISKSSFILKGNKWAKQGY